jgi:hypothetical protein
VAVLSVHEDGGVGDGSKFGLPSQVGAAEDVSGVVGVFAADFDVAGLEGVAEGFEGEEAEGVSETFSHVLNKRKVCRRSCPDLIRLSSEASDMSSLGDGDWTMTSEWVWSISCHWVGSFGLASWVVKKSAGLLAG